MRLLPYITDKWQVTRTIANKVKIPDHEIFFGLWKLKSANKIECVIELQAYWWRKRLKK